LICKQLFTAL